MKTVFDLRKKELRNPSALISYLVCEPLERAGFINAFSTRSGGVSPFPENALHLAYQDDSPANVDENRRRFRKAAGMSDLPIITAHQTHSDGRAFIEKMPDAIAFCQQEPEGDTLLTLLKEIFLGVKTADCVPILVGDPQTGAMAAIHAGWRGTVARVVEKTILDLKKSCGVRPQNCIAALGPAACGNCYEVGEDVIQQFQKEFGKNNKWLGKENLSHKTYLDVAAANAWQLERAGLMPDNIHIAPYCTMHQNDLFFSYRCEGQKNQLKVGRMVSVIGKAQSSLSTT